ncbi:MAG: RsmD family RNA methyltransferase, partial [Mycoplasmataceae bacterium]|nr:RsmD family RNA methyltransferase [Mycoplasmataceae bacterium]
LSRNAKKAIAIEKDKFAYEIIKQNAQSLNETNIEIKLMDSINYLKTEKELVFDFIYLDPPYKLDIIYQSLELILKNELLKNNGKIIIETNFEKQFEMPDGLEVFDQRIYGKTKLIFIKKI